MQSFAPIAVPLKLTGMLLGVSPLLMEQKPSMQFRKIADGFEFFIEPKFVTSSSSFWIDFDQVM